jgi:hypothetical protein
MSETELKPTADMRRDTPLPVSGILWLASYPKSGNTWTRAFLHNLLKIVAGEEGEQDINKLNRFSTSDTALAYYTEILGFTPTQEHREQVAKVRYRVQQHIADADDGIVLLKTHNALVYDRGYPLINFGVTSGAIYIVRNPLDVVISFAHHLNMSIDDTIVMMARTNCETNINEKRVYEIYGSWSQHVESWTRKPHRAVYVMRYEDMLAEPDKLFAGLARHLLINATPAQLAQAIKRSSFGRLQQKEAQDGFRERPKHASRFFREGRAGQWKEVLSAKQVDQLVKDHSEQMTRYGYLPL